MAIVINCGEQDIEDNGMCISMSIRREDNDTPKVIYMNMIDNLLGTAKFIRDCGCNFAEVGFDYEHEYCDYDAYLKFREFLDLPKNKRLKEIFQKYVSYKLDDIFMEDMTIWYSFIIESKGKDMTQKDILDFSRIFKELCE